ncbi:hypothetical protein [Ekhidna sp.]
MGNSFRKLAYDSNNFVSRVLILSDYSSNSVNEFEYRGDTIIEKRRKLKHLNWEYDIDDFDSLFNETKIFHLVEKGLIVESIKNFSKTDYSYDSLGRLIRKRIKDGDKVRSSFFYFYDEKTQLLSKEIFRNINGDTVYIKSYEQGILSNTEKGFRFGETYTLEYYRVE